MNALRRIRDPGFTIVEVILATAILAIAITALCSAYLSAMNLDDMSQQAAIATQTAREKLEEIPQENFSTLYERYNSDPADDPGGAGTAPGSQQATLNTFWINNRYSLHPGSSFSVTRMNAPPFDVPGYGTMSAIGRVEFHNYDARNSLHEVHVRIVWKGSTEMTDQGTPPNGTTFVELVTLMSQRVP